MIIKYNRIFKITKLSKVLVDMVQLQKNASVVLQHACLAKDARMDFVQVVYLTYIYLCNLSVSKSFKFLKSFQPKVLGNLITYLLILLVLIPGTCYANFVFKTLEKTFISSSLGSKLIGYRGKLQCLSCNGYRSSSGSSEGQQWIKRCSLPIFYHILLLSLVCGNSIKKYRCYDSGSILTNVVTAPFNEMF